MTLRFIEPPHPQLYIIVLIAADIYAKKLSRDGPDNQGRDAGPNLARNIFQMFTQEQAGCARFADCDHFGKKIARIENGCPPVPADLIGTIQVVGVSASMRGPVQARDRPHLEGGWR